MAKGRRRGTPDRTDDLWARLGDPEEWVVSAEEIERLVFGTACPHGHERAIDCRECAVRVLARRQNELICLRLGTTPEVAREVAAHYDRERYGPPAAAH